MSNLLEVSGLHTCFRTEDELITIVDGVSLNIRRGEIIGLVGESGSGKSVTMMSTIQLLSGSGRVTAGRVELDEDGVNILDYRPNSTEMQKVRGGRIGMIFQEPMTSLNPVITIGNQIQETIMLHLGLGKEEAKKKAVDMLKLVNIPDAEERYSYYPQQFSGGMRQRIMMAMVLAAQPDILIADEATTALDVTTQAQLLDMIRDLAVRTGIAVVIVTHNLGVVARYAQRIYVMYAGNVVETAESAEIFKDPQHPYTRGLLKAIPRLDDPKDRVLIPIHGLPPTPRDRPKYCPFYQRCRYRMDKCRELDNPRLSEITPGHFAACHLTPEEKRAKQDDISKVEYAGRAEKKVSAEVCLEVTGLGKSFDVYRGLIQRKVGSFNALEDISFNIHKGETLGIVGESGCGKTTLARCLLRDYEPNTGTIRLFDTDITHMKSRALAPFRRKISMVFQDPFSSLNPRMDAGAIVGEPLRIHKLTRSVGEYDRRVDELFELVGMDPNLKDRFPHEFSGGQRQRLGIARALAPNPDLMICDEPISALDVSIQAQVINLLEALQSKFGLAYMFIAHDIAVVKHISDRILVMYLGRVMEVADSDALCDRPMHPYTKALLSAVPIADPEIEKARDFVSVKGEVPSVMNRPKGCPFSDRCAFAMERCRQEIPQLRELGNGHAMACFL